MRKKFGIYTFLIIIFVSWFYLSLPGQDPLRFTAEIEPFSLQDVPSGEKPLVVFTGSSSIRAWDHIEDYFPELRILNRGFGGSQMSDLQYFINECILQYKPDQVFIYEGDNDLATGKTAEEIIRSAKEITVEIRRALPSTEIVFISPKPSPARWHLKEEYLELNRKLKEFSENEPGVEFVDIWTGMLTADGRVMDDLFLEDKLHMNEKGYRIWARSIRPFLITFVDK